MINLGDLKVLSFDVVKFDLVRFDHLFDNVTEGFKVNAVLNNNALIQLGTDGAWAIPNAIECGNDGKHEGMQNHFCENFNGDYVAKYLGLPTTLEECENFTV